MKSIAAYLDIEDGTAYSDGEVIPIAFLPTTPLALRYISSASEWQLANHCHLVDSQVNGVAMAGGSRTVTSGYEYRTYVVGTISDADGTLLERATRTSG